MVYNNFYNNFNAKILKDEFRKSVYIYIYISKSWILVLYSYCQIFLLANSLIFGNA